ncbi:hypothetical protein MYP_3880 [Sporocytophaga myxococcoides]|uniref:Uncharacterized protein n=1 Tax=Sporocytophaga myxococcoides TaxID=153721 RepID=A0A098LI55_9BACT|nr:hypothetical protein [Sporocytophaga myxococcoides]GAL86650.1 hypothetical protein MYP_3880 [Sporocytophaga myxococcoides]
MKREITIQVKTSWLSRMFFGASQYSYFNTNPIDDYSVFLNTKIGSLSWGNNKKEAKEDLAKSFKILLDLYDIKLPLKYIQEQLENESQTNKEAAEKWSLHSEFPANW